MINFLFASLIIIFLGVLLTCYSLLELPLILALFVEQTCYGAPVVQKTVHHMGAKATDIRTQRKAHGVSIDISVPVPWWRRRVSRSDHHRWCHVDCAHYPRNQAAVNALASQWIFLQDEIQRFCRRSGCVQCSGTDGTFSSSTSGPEMRRWMLRVTAKHYRNCDGPFRISGAGCLVPLLFCYTITLGHTRLEGSTHLMQFSWEVFTHPPYNLTSRPVLGIV